jgi:hypothetical protein
MSVTVLRKQLDRHWIAPRAATARYYQLSMRVVRKSSQCLDQLNLRNLGNRAWNLVTGSQDGP